MELPFEQQFPVNAGPDGKLALAVGPGQAVLQYRYFEVKELLLRPWLYIFLYLRGNNLPWMQVIPGELDDQGQEQATQHQALVLVRLHLELKHHAEGALRHIDGPWMRITAFVTLALLLFAHQCQSSSKVKFCEKFEQVQVVLRSYGNLGSLYADMLKEL